MRTVGALMAVAALAVAQSATETPPDVRLEVSTRGGQTTFCVGEVIPLELSFTSSTPKKYELDMASYDRSGRLNAEKFTVVPADGWVDPLDLYFRAWGGFIGGGIRGIGILSEQPSMIHEALNEWIRFDKPGVYGVTVRSTRVRPAERSLTRNEVPVVSNELRLTITNATPEWQADTLAEAQAVLKSSTPNRPGSAGTAEHRQEAVNTIRYLGTPEAARVMARLQEPAYRFGLAASPSRASGLEEMKRLLKDPDTAIDTDFLQVMSMLALPDGPGQRWAERVQLEKAFRRDLMAALPAKKGAALATSAKALLTVGDTLTANEQKELVGILAANFDSLSATDQANLIQYQMKGWEPQTALPLLKKVALRYQYFSQLRNMDAVEFNRASAAALEQWYAAAPDEARAAVLAEIARPEPRFGVNVLGILPERELAREAALLVAHLKATGNLDAQVNIASLIRRYGDASAKSEVLSFLDAGRARYACNLQTPLLAWVLQIDPESAQPRLELALAARANTGCYQRLLVEVGDLQESPVLERMSLKALNDAEPNVVASAAQYLEKHGTAPSEAALWERLTAWHEQFAGHPEDLRQLPLQDSPAARWSNAGGRLRQALSNGQGWLLNEAELRRLVDLMVDPVERQLAEKALKAWQTPPLRIQVYLGGQIGIANYQPTTVEHAKEKLRQFPKGTEFEVIHGGPKDESLLSELTAVAKEQGLVIRPPVK
jgi:hypothetical protein